MVRGPYHGMVYLPNARTFLNEFTPTQQRRAGNNERVNPKNENNESGFGNF